MSDTKIWVVLAGNEYFIAACASKDAARQKVIEAIKSEISCWEMEKEEYEDNITTEDEAEEYERIIAKLNDLESSISFFENCSYEYTEIASGFIVRPTILHTLEV